MNNPEQDYIAQFRAEGRGCNLHSRKMGRYLEDPLIYDIWVDTEDGEYVVPETSKSGGYHQNQLDIRSLFNLLSAPEYREGEPSV